MQIRDMSVSLNLAHECETDLLCPKHKVRGDEEVGETNKRATCYQKRDMFLIQKINALRQKQEEY